MSNLNNIIKVSITRNTTQPSQTGFGTMLILSADPELHPEAGQEWGSENVRTYTNLSSVKADFSTKTNVFAKAAAAFGQTPSPDRIKVGKISGDTADHEGTFTVTDATLGSQVGFTINDLECYVTVTSGAEGDLNAVADLVNFAAAAAIGSVSPPLDITFNAAVGADITFTGNTAGERFRFGGFKNVDYKDDTTIGNSAAVTALGKIIDEDNDFYAVAIDGTSEAEIKSVSDYINGLGDANPKLFFYRTQDSDVAAPGDADIMSVLSAASALRTVGWYTTEGSQIDAAILGSCLPELPGGVNWGWRNLNNVTGDSYTDTVRNRLLSYFEGTTPKLGNVYSPIASVNVSQWGITAGKEWVDTVRGSDWVSARIAERVAALLIKSDKVPFTDEGLTMIYGEIKGQLDLAVSQGFLSANPPPSVEVPLAANISDADKQARHLRGVTFRGIIQGAINSSEFLGELDL